MTGVRFHIDCAKFVIFQEGQCVQTIRFYWYLKLFGIVARSTGSGAINCGTDPPPSFTRGRGQDDVR